MARVFAVPNYLGASEGRYGSLHGATGPSAAALMSEAAEWDSSAFRDIIADEFEIPAADRERVLSALDLAGDSQKARVAMARVSAVVAELAKNKTTWWDADAAYRLYERIVSGACPIRGTHDGRTRVACEFGDAIFATGVAGGYASPIAAKRVADELDVAAVTLPTGVGACRLIALSDDIRLGWAVRGAANALASPFEEVITTYSCGHGSSNLANSIPSLNFYTVGFLLVATDSSCVYILNRNARYNLAACLYSAAMWCIAGRMDERKGAAAAADAGITFVVDALRSANRRGTCGAAVARAMKSSYAVLLCDLQTSLDAAFQASQRSALVGEVEAAFPGAKHWHDTIASHDRDLRIDYGTAWNLVPPPDIDASLLVQAVKSKVNAPRTFNRTGWESFVTYSAAVISARYIHANPDLPVKWHSGRVTDPEWATACRTDRSAPTYPAADERDYIVDTIDWKLHLENWHHSAQDVTHVYADAAKYAKGAPRLRPDEANELLYVLHNGAKMSSVHNPADVRIAWSHGSIPGSRVLYCSGKSENTKFGAKVRETMSADDILRECLTEIDINMATISKYAGGVAMRAGRAGTEALIENVVKEARSGGILFSMDVSGWSPNMHRAGEMMFIDTLMSMFKIPTKMRASAVFRDLNVVVDKYPCHVMFPMVDGSVQGFFGTADTIMHSMLAQYVLHEAKRQKLHPDLAEAVVAKVTLIDDILFSVKNTTAPADLLLRIYKTGYADLGFEVDTVKSLVGSDTGVFLNRIYTTRGEITTSAKIFAKADREWDRNVVGIYDEVASVFAGFSGAVDRGYSALRAYRMACIRAAYRITASAHPVSLVDKAVTGMVAFLPPGLGGFGIPDISSWVTENAGGSLAAHINVVTTAMRHAATSDRRIYTLGECILHYILTEKTRSADAWAVATAPAAVCYDDFSDPMSIFSNAITTAIRKRNLAGDIANMVTATRTDRDVRALTAILTNGTFDAPLVADYMACMPDSIGAAMLSRFAKSSACMSLVGFKRSARARQDVIKVGRLTVSRCHSRLRAIPAGADRPLPNATEVATVLISRRCSGLNLVNTVIPAPLDAIRHVSEGGTIKVYMNHAVTREARTGISGILRTYSCSIIENVEQLVARDVSPLSSAARRLIRAVSFIAATGSGITALCALASKVWGFDIAALRVLAVPDINPRRVSIATASRNHCVRAYPNSGKSVSVAMTAEMNANTSIRTNVDYMTMRAVLSASALIDLDAGAPVGMTRHYIIRKSAAFLQQSCIGPSSDVDVTARRMVVGSVARAFEASVISSLAGVSVISIATTDEGQTAYAVPDTRAPMTVSAIMNARSLFSAIAGSATAHIEVDAGDTAETKVVTANPMHAMYASLASALAPLTGMPRKAAIAKLQEDAEGIFAAADATKNSAIQSIIRASLKRENTHIMDDIRAIHSALLAVTGDASSYDYTSAVRRACAANYAQRAEALQVNSSADEREHGLSYGFSFAASVFDELSTVSGRNTGVLRFLTLKAVHSKASAMVHRSGIATTEFTVAPGGDTVDAAEAIVRSVFPANWADLASIVAGARFAAKRAVAYCSMDDAAAPTKTAAVIHDPVTAEAAAVVDHSFALLDNMDFGAALAGLAHIPDEFDVSDIIGATVRTGSTRNADDE